MKIDLMSKWLQISRQIIYGYAFSFLFKLGQVFMEFEQIRTYLEID